MLAIASGSPETSPSSALARSRYRVAVSAAAILKSYVNRTLTFPRALLHRAALRFFSTRSAFAALDGARRLALARYDMGSGNHFRQPPPRVGSVRLLGAKAAGGDQQLACRR